MALMDFRIKAFMRSTKNYSFFFLFCTIITCWRIAVCFKYYRCSLLKTSLTSWQRFKTDEIWTYTLSNLQSNFIYKQNIDLVNCKCSKVVDLDHFIGCVSREAVTRTILAIHNIFSYIVVRPTYSNRIVGDVWECDRWRRIRNF